MSGHHDHQRHARGAQERAMPQRNLRLPPNYRRLAYTALAAVWITGILWLVLHYFMMRQGEFGSEPHPFEAWSLRMHGLIAFVTLFVAGLLWGVHVRPGLLGPKRRTSGIALLVLLGWLAATGYLLYYASDDGLRNLARWAHWLVGVAAALPFLLHALRGRAERKESERRE
jgi:hypothetical protein